MDRRLNIEVLAAIVALAIGATVALGEWLKRIVVPGPLPSVEMVSLIAATTLVGAVAAALALALIVRTITVAGGFAIGFWPTFAILVQDYALFLAIWTVLWGAPFAVAIIAGIYLNRWIVGIAAFAAGVALAIGLLLVFRRVLSDDVWRIASQFNPAPRIGNLRMLVLLAVFLTPTRFYVDHCYVFDIAIPATSVARNDQLEVHAHLAGRILDHGRLRLSVNQLGSGVPLRVQRFDMEEPGSYIALVDLSGFKEGSYRARVFMADAPRNWKAPWFSDKALERSFVIRVRPAI